jgi:hypothetical protein
MIQTQIPWLVECALCGSTNLKLAWHALLGDLLQQLNTG